MKNKFPLLLALPFSTILFTTLNPQHSYSESHLATGGEPGQKAVQIAALPTGSLRTPLLVPFPSINRSRVGGNNIQKLAPVIVVPVPVAVPPLVPQQPSATSKPKTTTTTSKRSSSSAAAIKKTSTRATKSTKKKSRTIKKASKSRVHLIVRAQKSPIEDVKTVALTFDDGPNPIYTPQILAILKKEHIHATFCLIGREVKRYPELVQQIVAEGHKVADHSMNHDEHLDKRSDSKVSKEVLSTKELIESIVPGTAIEYFRAPAGNSSPHLRELAASWGMKSLGWSVDTKDWQRPGVDEIISTLNKQLHSGGIVLMHDAGGDRSDTVTALEKVIPQLKKDGYEFVFPG